MKMGNMFIFIPCVYFVWGHWLHAWRACAPHAQAPMSALHACSVLRGQKRAPDTLRLSYRRLWVAMWGPRPEPGSSDEGKRGLKCWATSPMLKDGNVKISSSSTKSSRLIKTNMIISEGERKKSWLQPRQNLPYNSESSRLIFSGVRASTPVGTVYRTCRLLWPPWLLGTQCSYCDWRGRVTCWSRENSCRTIIRLSQVIFQRNNQLLKWLLTCPFATSSKSLTLQPLTVPISLQMESSTIR